jgi:hypothetical protein
LLDRHREEQARIARQRAEGSTGFSSKAPLLSFLHGVSQGTTLITKLGRHEFCPELSAATAKPG